MVTLHQVLFHKSVVLAVSFSLSLFRSLSTAIGRCTCNDAVQAKNGSIIIRGFLLIHYAFSLILGLFLVTILFVTAIDAGSLDLAVMYLELVAKCFELEVSYFELVAKYFELVVQSVIAFSCLYPYLASF